MATSITNTSITTDNLTVDTNTIYVDSTNNRVGIGTASPLSELHQDIGLTNREGHYLYYGTDPKAAFTVLPNTGEIRIGAATAGTSGNYSTEIMSRNGSNLVTSIKADAYGRVTTPNQPSFLMKKYSGGATAISNNSVWTYDEALTNVGGHANISNGRFTAPVAGNYCFMWHNIGENSGAVYRSFIRLNTSGTWGTGSYRLESRNYHSSGYPNASAQVVVPLSASDYVDIYASGGNIYSDQTNGAWFCGFLIG